MEPTRPLRERSAEAVPGAMCARDRDRLRVLRATLGVTDNAGAVPVTVGARSIEEASIGAGSTDVPRRDLTELEVVGLVRAEVEERERAAATYDAPAPDRARRLRAEAAVLRAFLGA